MGYLIGIPLLASLAVLQATLFGQFRLLNGAPDLLLLAVVTWVLTGKQRQAMTLGLIGGVFLDLFSGFPLGASALALILVTFLVSLTEDSFWEAYFLMPLAAVLIASLIYHGLNLLVLLLMGRLPDLNYAFTQVILPSVFLNLVLALPVSQLIDSLVRSLYPPEIGI